MALVPMTELLAKAEAGGYAVGAFNANNMEIVQAIAMAAEKEQAPVIMQASQGAIKYAGLEYIIGLVKIAADSTRIPIALHLDHGTSFEQVVRCIRGGFSSVMFDGSQLPFAVFISGYRRCHHFSALAGNSCITKDGYLCSIPGRSRGWQQGPGEALGQKAGHDHRCSSMRSLFTTTHHRL